MNPQFMAIRELQRLETQARYQASQVQRARTLEAVLQLAQLSSPAWIRALSRTLAGVRELDGAIRGRLRALVGEQLECVRRLPVSEQATALQRLETREWSCLRGTYSEVLGYAQRESLRIRRAHRETRAFRELSRNEPAVKG